MYHCFRLHRGDDLYESIQRYADAHHIAAGGVLYTLGAWFYARQGFRYHHMVWHLLINLAVAAHFTGIVFFLY